MRFWLRGSNYEFGTRVRSLILLKNHAPLLPTFVVYLSLANFVCDPVRSLNATQIKDILERPRDYENKEVTIYGTVTNAVSLLVVKYFEVQDDTGSIKVVTDKLLPTKGQKMKVTGRMAVIEVGTERWIVLREKSPGETRQEKQ